MRSSPGARADSITRYIYKDPVKSSILRASNIKVRRVADVRGLVGIHAETSERGRENLARRFRITCLGGNRDCLEKRPQLKTGKYPIKAEIEVRDDAEPQACLFQMLQDRMRTFQRLPVRGIGEVGE